MDPGDLGGVRTTATFFTSLLAPTPGCPGVWARLEGDFGVLDPLRSGVLGESTHEKVALLFTVQEGLEVLEYSTMLYSVLCLIA